MDLRSPSTLRFLNLSVYLSSLYCSGRTCHRQHLLRFGFLSQAIAVSPSLFAPEGLQWGTKSVGCKRNLEERLRKTNVGLTNNV